MAKKVEDSLVGAAVVGDAKTVERLLRRGASPNSVSEGTTAVYAGSMRNDATIVQLLLDAGGDPNVESDAEGDGTPLCGAASWGFSPVIEALLRHEADPNQREDHGTGFSPLLWACRGGHLEAARLLLEAGADPNTAVYGTTALHGAAERGSAAVVRLLLDHGARQDPVDDEGRTPLDLAQGWIGKDVETELRAQAGAAEAGEVTVTRAPRPDGTELVTVKVRTSDGGAWCVERETGHGVIAEVLRSARDTSGEQQAL